MNLVKLNEIKVALVPLDLNKGNMMSVRVNYADDLKREHAYKKVKAQITPANMEKYKVKADFSYYENQNISAKGKGFDMDMDFYDDHVKIRLNLSFLLSPLKGRILDSIQGQVKRLIGY